MTNDNQPYTYLIGWSQHDTWYYGVRYRVTASPHNDLWQSYFTSSKYVKNFRKLYGEPDVVRVRRTFDSKEKALYWEHKVLRRMRVRLSDRWLNKNDLLAPPSLSGKDHPFYGKTHSEETKQKMSEEKKGKTHSEKTKQKLSEANKGKTLSEKTKQKMSETRKGKTLSEETKQKMSETRKGQVPWNKGKTFSEEHRRKLSETRRMRNRKKILSSGVASATAHTTTSRLIFT